MSWNYYRYIDNWHSHPWISWLLCKIGRHDYGFMWMDGDSGILSCFYCEQQCNSRTDLGDCKHCSGKLGKDWICWDRKCREERQANLAKSIAEAEAQGLYEISEHISGSEIG